MCAGILEKGERPGSQDGFLGEGSILPSGGVEGGFADWGTCQLRELGWEGADERDGICGPGTWR